MQLERIDDVALLRLRGGKANSVSPDFLQGLIGLFDRVEASDARAIVITGYERHFSAGLALPMLLDLERAEMRAYIDLFGQAMLRAFRCERPVVAAINGHAIAGGCVLALMADYRIMAEGPARIGLNEVQLGIGLPAVVVEPLRLQVPPSSLLPIAIEGQLFSPEGAGLLGLVHQVVEPNVLEAKAIEKAHALAQPPLSGFAQIKLSLRR